MVGYGNAWAAVQFGEVYLVRGRVNAVFAGYVVKERGSGYGVGKGGSERQGVCEMGQDGVWVMWC